jgi:cytochrome c-type biogenesis protein CcmH/NrfG
MSAVTVQRNEVWRSAISLWEDTVAQSPGKARAWCNLGTAYGEAQRREDALRCFRKAVELEPRYETAHVNAAFILNDLNRFSEAAAQCDQLVVVTPEAATHVEVVHCLAVARIGLGQVQQGLAQLETIATTVPDYRPTQVMLGLIYSRLQQPRMALRYWRNAQRLHPDSGLATMIDAAERAVRLQHSTASLRE